jgi:cyclase
MFTELAPGVFSVEHRVVEGKNGVLFGNRHALAIDTGSDAEEGEAVAAFIRARGRQPEWLALTHGHGDHVLGGAVFVGAEVFAHVNMPAVIRKQIPGWAEVRTRAPGAGASNDEIAARVSQPTITFTDELRIDLGGRQVHLFHTPGHSDDSACVYLPGERILFAGDTVVTGIVPAIGDGSGVAMEASLRRLAELEIEILVAGHGPVLHGARHVRDWLGWQASYLAGARAFVRASLAQGDPADAVADAAGYERFVGDRLPADRHGMLRRHRNTVMKIIQEETRPDGSMALGGREATS